ncbi:MAG: type I-E CRISPR-associated protein Cse1/CasA [Candidatus Glassbacteria bacterium]
MSYNLLDEQWIPVLWADGKNSRVGIMEALTQAGRIRQVAASNPMDRFAVIRFLLALLYWCKDNLCREGDLTGRTSKLTGN